MLPHLNLDMEKKTWGKREAYTPDITIVTALFDGRMTGVPHTTGVYDAAYVEKLYRGFQRNLTIPFGFICLVDKNFRKIIDSFKIIRILRRMFSVKKSSVLQIFIF